MVDFQTLPLGATFEVISHDHTARYTVRESLGRNNYHIVLVDITLLDNESPLQRTRRFLRFVPMSHLIIALLWTAAAAGTLAQGVAQWLS